MSDRAEHAVNRQTKQAIDTIGRIVRWRVRHGIDPAPFLAAIERECRKAQAEDGEVGRAA